MSRAKLALPALVLVALATSTAAYSTFISGGPSPDPFVVGGGRQVPGASTVFNLGSRDFSVDSHVEKKGLKTYGILRYGLNDNATESTRLGDVRCVKINGNRAVVGGTSRGSSPAEGWVTFFVDNGRPVGQKDQASYLLTDPLDSPNWPAGFPNTCPGADSYAGDFLDLDAGDIIVSAGSS